MGSLIFQEPFATMNQRCVSRIHGSAPAVGSDKTGGINSALPVGLGGDYLTYGAAISSGVGSNLRNSSIFSGFEAARLVVSPGSLARLKS